MCGTSDLGGVGVTDVPACMHGTSTQRIALYPINISWHTKESVSECSTAEAQKLITSPFGFGASDLQSQVMPSCATLCQGKHPPDKCGRTSGQRISNVCRKRRPVNSLMLVSCHPRLCLTSA